MNIRTAVERVDILYSYGSLAYWDCGSLSFVLITYHKQISISDRDEHTCMDLLKLQSPSHSPPVPHDLTSKVCRLTSHKP